ncbi:PIG-L family deacetylase [Sanguibacter suaedae]|uniref:PIG-L family deacetylase n=1 Tax=Sanguibacter suaedae TaxID=2795737 RepID=A0A934MA32_9MICO|nr:PIG-L family deacetylase [Sanguibacter suaedae]MBI9115195.1 PIG-L family deacetylase [Sanguibacter suaedae]
MTEHVRPAGGLLAVHAHPDDETLATGALLATWAAAGEPVTVVTCTRGERGEVIGEALAHLEGDGPALAAHREVEIADALRHLGVADHAFLDAIPGEDGLPPRVEDSGMAWLGSGPPGTSGHAGVAPDVPENALVAVDLDAAAARLARLLRDRRPSVVVTYEPGGGYGHPDHVRAHEITMRAVALARVGSADGPAVDPDVWWAVVPPQTMRDARTELSAHVALGALDSFDAAHDVLPVLPSPDGPLPAACVPERTVTHVVDVLPVADAVEAALRAHGTQVHRLTRVPSGGTTLVVGWYALSNDVLVPWLSTEHYTTANPSDGPDGPQETSSDAR